MRYGYRSGGRATAGCCPTTYLKQCDDADTSRQNEWTRTVLEFKRQQVNGVACARCGRTSIRVSVICIIYLAVMVVVVSMIN